MHAAVMEPMEQAPTSFRFGPWVAGIAAWVLMLTAGWVFLNSGESRQVASLHIDGEFKRVSARQIEEAVRGRLDTGFVELVLQSVKADAEALPWVSSARVERDWPAGIRVRVWEREPLARWGEASLLDTRGRVFTPPKAELPQNLPLLSGEAGHEAEVIKTWQRLSALLADTPFALSGLAQDRRSEWTAQTQTGVGLRFGTDPDDARVEMLRGVAVRSLQARMSEVDYVDLRYTNGFAVGWKAVTPTRAPAAASGEAHG